MKDWDKMFDALEISKDILESHQLCLVDPMHAQWYGILGPNILFPSPHGLDESFSMFREQIAMETTDG